MAAIALGLFLVWFTMAFVVRSVVQYRTTGDTGLRAGMFRAGIGSIESIAGQAFVIALVAGAAAPVLALAGVEPLWSSSATEVGGVVVTVVGIVLTFLAQLAMGRAWRIGVDPEEATDLVTDGAFALARNPIFTAMLTTAAGLVLMVPNWLAVVGFVLLLVAIELQVRGVEEPHLRRLHGTTYARYAERVGRFVPLVGRG